MNDLIRATHTQKINNKNKMFLEQRQPLVILHDVF